MQKEIKQMQIEYIKTDELIPYIKNPKKHPKDQVNLIASSIKEFGFLNPIIIDKDNEIIAGHGRLLAAKKLGLEKVPVLRAEHLTPVQIKAYRIADNKLTELGEWDKDLLRVEVEDLKQSQEIDLELTGFTYEELKELLEEVDASVELDDEEEDEEAEKTPDLPEEPYTKQGDIWILGRHRLLCGDSFSKENIQKLINGQKIDAVITDPLYGMNLDTDFSDMKCKLHGKKYKKVLNDDKPFDPTFFLRLFKDVKEQFWWGADYYADKLTDLSLGKSSWIVWDKRTDENISEEGNKRIADADFTLSEFELCWSKTKHRRRIARISWFGIVGFQFEPEFKKDQNKKRFHPNQKPVRLYQWLINNLLKEEHKNIIDFFAGSGSLLIACEIEKRSFFGIEFDPQYVDGIVKRYIDYTGREDIKLIRDGKETQFSEIKEEFLKRFEE